MPRARRPDPLAALTRGFAFERRWLVAVFDTLVPAGSDPRLPLGARDFPMERFVEDLFRHAPLRFVLGVRACLLLLLLAPFWLGVRPTTFLGLSTGERLALLDRLRRSELYLLRELPLLLKTVACLGFCGHPEVQARLGIEPRDATPPRWALPTTGSDTT